MNGAASPTFDGLDTQLGAKISKWRTHDSETAVEFMRRAGYDDIDEVDATGWPVLFWAIIFGSMAVVKEIIRQRPDMLFSRKCDGLSMIPYAVARPPEDFKELLSLDPRCRSLEELNYASPNGFTAVDRAAKLGFHENLRYLLELGAVPDACRHVNGATPLLFAAEEGYPLCVAVLLEFHADVAAVDKQNRTALHMAAQFVAPIGNHEPGCKLKVIEVLLHAKAPTHLVDSFGRTALQVAVETTFQDA
eukprot:899450-Amphidinium_carterae.1